MQIKDCMMNLKRLWAWKYAYQSPTDIFVEQTLNIFNNQTNTSGSEEGRIYPKYNALVNHSLPHSQLPYKHFQRLKCLDFLL